MHLKPGTSQIINILRKGRDFEALSGHIRGGVKAR